MFVSQRGTWVINVAQILDGADVTQGKIADTAVTGDNPGTVNQHLRGISSQFVNVGVLLLPQAVRTVGTNVTRSPISAKGVIFTLGVVANPGVGFLRLTCLLISPLGNAGAGVAFIDTDVGVNAIYQLIIQAGALTPSGTNLVKAFGYGIGGSYKAIVDHSASGSWTYYLEAWETP